MTALAKHSGCAASLTSRSSLRQYRGKLTGAQMRARSRRGTGEEAGVAARAESDAGSVRMGAFAAGNTPAPRGDGAAGSASWTTTGRHVPVRAENGHRP